MFIALGLLALLLVLAVAAPRVARLLTRQVPGEEEPGEAPKPVAEGAEEAAAVERRIDVKLFFQSPGARGLMIEDRAVVYSEDLSQQLRFVVEALVEGPRTGWAATLPPETKVLDVFVNEQGTAYVDLSGHVSTHHVGGSDAELATVYSVVNSLTSNFPAVKRVQILVDDHPVITLAGHVNLARPLYPDMTLLLLAPDPASAPSTELPAAGGTPAPAAAAPVASPAMRP